MDTAQILTDLRAQRERITAAITALESLTGSTPAPAAKTPASAAAKSVKTTSASTKRAVSPEGRQRMAEAQQKRWAKKKRAEKYAAKKAAAPPVAISAKSVQVAVSPVKGARKPMNPATKKKLATAARARWAAKKAPAKMA